MEKDIQTDILNILREKRSRVELGELERILVDKYGYPSRKHEYDDSLSKEILHFTQVLESANFVLRESEDNPLLGFGPRKYYYFELKADGYKQFIPWYKKLWSFLNDDLTKLLSLISLILSIIATLISLSK